MRFENSARSPTVCCIFLALLLSRTHADTAAIQTVTPMKSSPSWVGQTVTLKCVADVVPTPTLTWKKPDGSEIKKVKATVNRADVVIRNDQDFGQYTCEVNNGAGSAATSIVQVQQIKAPGSPVITSTAADIQATSLTVKWTAPADDGGSPITAYRVVILLDGVEMRDENVIKPAASEKFIGGLNKSTNYTVKVYARNFVFEGNANQKIIKTRFEGVPAAAEILEFPACTREVKVTINWNEPQNNGASITQYTVYQRIVTDDGTPRQWNNINDIKDISVRQVAVNLEKGKDFQFVVTATNKFGESLKEEEKIRTIAVLGGSLYDRMIIPHHIYNTIIVQLAIITLILTGVLWKMRRTSENVTTSERAAILQVDNGSKEAL